MTVPPSAGTRAQPHGGALLAGGQAGNRGGSGAPPSSIRARCRASFVERIAIAEQIADDPAQPPRDRLKALELLARIGMGALEAGPLSDDEVKREELRSGGASAMDALLATSW